MKNFVDGCGLDPPLTLLVIGANGAIAVRRVTATATEVVCRSGEAFTAPLVLAAIAPCGNARTAQVTVENTPPVMQ